MEQERPKLATVQPETPESPLTVYVWPRDVDVYQVFAHEFKSIKAAASQSGLYLTFFGISFGLMAALLIVLATVDLTSPRAFAAFVVGFAVSVITTALLGIKAHIEYKGTNRQIDDIEEQSRKRRAITQPSASSSPYTQDLVKR